MKCEYRLDHSELKTAVLAYQVVQEHNALVDYSNARQRKYLSCDLAYTDGVV